jgi:hypothetical protein
MGIELVPVESEALRAIGYDRSRSVLTVQFTSGSTFEYFDVPELLFTLMLHAQPHPWSRYGSELLAYEYRELAR